MNVKTPSSPLGLRPLQLLLMQSLYGLAICVFLVIRQNLDKKQQDELWSTWAVLDPQAANIMLV